jgi:hypothetical protein
MAHTSRAIGSPINGLGMAGVAPNVTLVNLRAGQDSVLLPAPSVDALRSPLTTASTSST